MTQLKGNESLPRNFPLHMGVTGVRHIIDPSPLSKGTPPFQMMLANPGAGITPRLPGFEKLQSLLHSPFRVIIVIIAGNQKGERLPSCAARHGLL